MGRSSSSTKRTTGTAANQHNPKHENGIVAPTKKLQKQRSNGHLNGGPRTTDKVPATPPLPATPPNGIGLGNNVHPRHPNDVVAEQKSGIDGATGISVDGSTYTESTSSEPQTLDGSMATTPEIHRQIDVNAAKNPAVHRDAGPFGFLITVLRSCPLSDTIAILIVLLQLPPTFLTIIHLLFTTLTFVPPSTTSSSSFAYTDIFEGTLGTPSLATIIAVDGLVLLVWLFLWRPFQDVALDLAQTVIALTLGGGTSGRDAGFHNVLICLGVIGASHFAHYGAIKKTSLRMLLPIGSSGLLGVDSDDPLEPPPQRKTTQGGHAWIRTILAIHILTQGVVRYIRDWYVRRERRDSLLNTAGDPEAGKGSSTSIESGTTDGNNVQPQSLSSDNDPAVNSASEKTISAKKKRKVSAQVRSRQPLWAALASTKIVMAKEYETSRHAAESAGTNATDVNNLGNAPFNTEPDRIWITDIGSDKICFNTSHFPACAFLPNDKQEEGESAVLETEKRPFYVRVNKSLWAPTRIRAVEDASDSHQVQWTGEIFGLAPMSLYECQFISTVDESMLFETSIRTTQAPTTDTLPTQPVLQGFQQSPTSTLKTSIATAEAKLCEERNRLKRERKEQRSKMNTTRKEIDKLSHSITSSGGSDDRLRQKIQQANLHAKQAEEAAIQISADLEALEALPEEDAVEFKVAKEAWQTQKDIHKAARNDYQQTKQDADDRLANLSAEVSSYQQKRERMHGRINKLNSEFERITDANARGLDEAQRKASERAAREEERVRLERLYIERLEHIVPQIQSMQQTLAELWAGIQQMQQAELAVGYPQTQQSPTVQLPSYDIHDGSIAPNPAPAAYPWNPSTYLSSNSTNVMQNKSQHGRTRGRSSSMLSAVSGFTEDESDEPAPPHPVGAELKLDRQRQQSEGGGSSGSGTSGSVSDPKSPTVGHASAATISGAASRFSSYWDDK